MPAVNTISNITPNAAVNQQNGLLQSMRPGQSVTVEVVSSEPGMLTVKTPDGQTLSAEFPGATVMAPGDRLELTLLSSPQGEHPQFQLSAVNNQNVQISTSVMEAKMIDLGVEPSEINVKAAEFLAERGVQPTPERLATITKIATYFPQLPASTALFVAANNIQPTRSNISALAELLSGSDLLGDDAQSLEQDVKDILKQASASVKESLQSPVQNNPISGETRLPSPITAQTAQTFTENFVGQVIRNPEFPSQTVPLPALANFAESLINMSQSEAQAAINDFLGNYPSLSSEEKAALADILNNAYEQTSQNAQAQTPDIESQGAQRNPQTVNNAPTQSGQAEQTDAQPQTSTVTASEEQIGASVENTDGNINQTDDAKGNQNLINTDNARQALPGGNDIKAEAQKVLQQIEKLVVSMKNDNTADAEALKETVKTQLRTADSIKEGMARITGENSAPAQKAGDMATRIQLGNQIDNFYYCQVPFKMGETQNTAELYVFNRKKSDAANDKINTTILIALETQRMGRVETVLRAEENNLNLEFRVETDKIQRYLEKETEQLKKSLEESSFNVVGVKVVRIDVPATPLNVDQLVGEKEDFELKTIDISV